MFLSTKILIFLYVAYMYKDIHADVLAHVPMKLCVFTCRGPRLASPVSPCHSFDFTWELGI